VLEIVRQIAIGLGCVSCVIAFASAVVLWRLAGRIQALSRKLGGDPPRVWPWPPPFRFFGSEPGFWDYVGSQCRKPGTEELRELVQEAKVVVTIETVASVGVLAVLVMAAVFQWS
jgi:hypothetical protein